MNNQLGIMMRTSTEFYVEKRPVNIIITTNKFSYWKNELVNVTVQVRDVFGLAVKNMQTHLKIYNPKTSYQYYVVDFTNDNGYVSFIWNATSIGKIEISVKSIETSIYYIRRVLFKEIWQLKYPPWTSEEAKELYKKYILSFVQSDSWLENLLKYILHPTLLQLTYSVALFQIIELEKPYSPAFLYSLTLVLGITDT